MKSEAPQISEAMLKTLREMQTSTRYWKNEVTCMKLAELGLAEERAGIQGYHERRTLYRITQKGRDLILKDEQDKVARVARSLSYGVYGEEDYDKLDADSKEWLRVMAIVAINAMKPRREAVNLDTPDPFAKGAAGESPVTEQQEGT